MKAWAGCVLAGLLVVGSTSLFAGESQAGKWGLSLNGGFNTYAMNDVNDMLANSGLSGSPSINVGGQAGLGVDYRIAETWKAGAQVNYLFASNSAAVPDGPGLVGKQDTTLNATEILAKGSYVFPRVATGLDLRVGVGLGALVLTGATQTLSLPAVGGAFPLPALNQTVDMSGAGFDGKIFVGADYYFLPNLSLGLDLGYRYAKASPITTTFKGQSQTWVKSDGSDGSVDYSGFNSQLALVWWI